MRGWVISSSYPRWPGESVNAGVLARDLSLTLARLGHEITVVTPEKPGGITFDDDLTGVSFRWYRPSREVSDLGKSPTDVLRTMTLMTSGLMRVTRLRRSSPPDFIIALWALPSAVFARAVARSCDIPYGVWLLGSDVWRADDLPMGRRVLSVVCRDAATVAADGRELRDHAGTITGTTIDFLPSSRRLPELGTHDFEPTDVVFVGRFHPNKGPDVLLDAISPRSGSAALNVEFYGAGPLSTVLESGARDLPEVTINDPIEAEALRARLESCRVLVIPSRLESIPLILGDAIQARCRVVVTDVGDMAQIVQRFGIGEVAKPGDPVSLGEAIAAALASDTEPDWEGAGAFVSPDRAALYFLEHFGSRHRRVPFPHQEVADSDQNS